MTATSKLTPEQKIMAELSGSLRAMKPYMTTTIEARIALKVEVSPSTVRDYMRGEVRSVETAEKILSAAREEMQKLSKDIAKSAA